jgi:IS5 family transposase
MRLTFDPQLRLGCYPIEEVPLNTSCRDEMIPLLKALQHLFGQAAVRDALLQRIADDLLGGCSARHGRKGMSFWQVLVLAAARLGNDLDFDKLQNLAEEHRSLRLIMGLHEWGDDPSFDWRCLRDNLCKVRPETLEAINHAVVGLGHELAPEAAQTVRADVFVAKTNVHYPTDSSLIEDGLRNVLKQAVALDKLLGVGGWRQHQHLLRQVRSLTRQIRRTAAAKGPNYRDRLTEPYRKLLEKARRLLERAQRLVDIGLARRQEGTAPLETPAILAELTYFVSVTEHACAQAQRRVLEGESVPNAQKLFSVFEPDTELIKRGKTPQPIEFGHRVMIFEDGAGFITHYAIVPLRIEERTLAAPVLRQLQERLGGRIERASFDKGFHSPENQKELAEIVAHPCVPTTGKRPAPQADTVEFRASRRRHPGVESAIGALQAGNGLERCRDRSRVGYDRYIALGILGRNLHVLGKLLLQQESPGCHAAQSQRQRQAG